MGEEADADWQDGLVEWGIEDTLARMDKILRHQPQCSCGSSQVQIMKKRTPALWRCRKCKTYFTSEPL